MGAIVGNHTEVRAELRDCLWGIHVADSILDLIAFEHFTWHAACSTRSAWLCCLALTCTCGAAAVAAVAAAASIDAEESFDANERRAYRKERKKERGSVGSISYRMERLLLSWWCCLLTEWITSTVKEIKSNVCF